jgi:SAM-dependent methyltransferase
MRPDGGAVLELGCGTGEIARMLAPHAERVDAIDISAAMLNRARSMPGGDHPAIRWILGSAEEAVFDAPYALAVAGDSLHWMKWETVLPRARDALAPGAPLAIVSAVVAEPPWSPELQHVIRRYSVMQDFMRYSIVDELAKRRLFAPVGEETIGPGPFTRTVGECIEALHATAGFPRERMGTQNAQLFDDAVRAIVAPFADDHVLRLSGSARVVWGEACAHAG